MTLGVLLLVGCHSKNVATKPPYVGETQPMYDVVKEINRNNNKLPTLWASISKMQISLVDDKQKRHDETLDGTLLYRSPRDVKVIGHADVVGNVLEIGSNRDLYWLIARKPGPDQAWWGRHKFLGDPRAKPIPVSPALLLEVLGVSTINEDFNTLPVPVMGFNNDSDAYMMIWNAKLPDRWVAVKEVWYDRATKRPLKVFLFDANGRIILSARLDKHKPVEVPDVPRENWPVVATDYRLNFPDSGSTMRLVLDDVQLKRKSAPSDVTFRFSPDKLDVSTVTQLDETLAARNPLLLLLFVVMLLPAAGRGADAAAPAPAQSAQASPQRDLLAHGTKELYWSADVVPTSERRGTAIVNGVKTTVRMRSAGQPQWREVAPIIAQARDLANRGNELLVTISDGSWMIVSDDGARTGIPLPGGARILAMCGDEDDIWAVGEAAKGQLINIPPPKPAATASAPSTSPSTTRAATAPAPTTVPAFPPHDVGLFLLRRGQWIERDVLPGSVRSGDVLAVSMAMIDRRLMLAMASRDGAVRVWSHDESGHWDAGAEVAVLSDRGEIKLMNLEGSAALWIADGTANASDAGMLSIREQRWGKPIKLASQPKLAAFDRRTLSTALGRIGLLASDGRGQLKEQLYNRDGSLKGEPIDAVTIGRQADDWLTQAFQFLIVVVLIVWMVGSMRQRPAVREAVSRVDELHLAHVGRRFLGGLIDLVPLVIGSFMGEQALHQSMPAGATSPPALTIDSPAFAWFAAGMGAYLLLTTALELITRGRSLGKLITGTRVASLDGSRATPSALLIRNLLRVIDIILFFPLSFVFFSPLRQRVGDMAGGTIVISNDAPEVEPRRVKPPDADDD